jgi:CubicO group peptidase (beta-lactamase class C family)
MIKQLLIILAVGFQMLYADDSADSLFLNIGRKYALAGMSVYVFSEGKGDYRYSYGRRDISRNLPVNRQTKYRIASISKYVTATAIFILSDRGLLDLDASASNGCRLQCL